MRKGLTITVVMNNATNCSGFCGFCTAANELGYGQGFDIHNAVDGLKAVNAKNQIKFDYDALEKAVLDFPGYKDNELVQYSIWGSEPLGNFDAYCELYDFLTYISKGKQVVFSGSTNGLPLIVPEWREWYLSKDNIHMQMSHDGNSNWMRTEGIDTIKLNEDFMRSGFITWISCVQNFYNSSPMKNIKFFEEHLPDDIRNKLKIRLYTVRDALYDSNQINKDGLFNGKAYEQLRGTRCGDLGLRNDPALADKYGIFEMAHALDDHFNEMEYIYKNIDKDRFRMYRDVLIQRVVYNDKKYMEIKDGIPDYPRPWCAEYHLGHRDTSNCIDTLGKQTPCHLYDSSTPIPNPKMEKPERCKDCPYNDSWECNICGSFFLNPNYCEWSYRFNQQMARLKQSRWIQDWMRVYVRDRRRMSMPEAMAHEIHNRNNKPQARR